MSLVGTPSTQPSTLHEPDAPLLVEFEDADPRNPINFSSAKKWVITITACGFTGITGAAISSYNLGVPTMVEDLHCSNFAATVGLSLYPLGFGIVPLFTSSLSEEFGRFPIYIVSTFSFMLMHVMTALAPNIQTVIVARFLSGSFGSTGATLVGGTIADIWKPDERGFPMALFAIAAIGASGLGPLFAGWIESNNHLGWRWIQWISAIVSGVYAVFVLLLLTETRADIILTRLARKMRQTKQDSRYRARAEIDKHSVFTLIKISSTRPIKLLLTEPTVMSFSLWIGFIWGVLFCFIDSINGEMGSIYHFTIVEEGSTYICITIGSILGWFANMYQEVLYKKYVIKKGPEARLCLALVAAVLLPSGMLIYAWTATSSIRWIAPLTGLTVFMVGTFIIYQAVFVYLADCYGPYASSALAGQSMCRNLLGAVFPLFTQQMYNNLTYKWANTLFALISVAMIPIPFILFVYGAAIRKRSQVSRKILALQQEKLAPESKQANEA
ncbi:major facilitator superfamily domain-containing protein [Boletus edulis BED1]|uniref:Major facilitator superfamily domain-containing protein n=1 Tax=Boletus edulis BED1 TaxID=1328754 RepID=A0AAD4C6Y5_BOLED|nr:major facilitator superfamily domain-containing protein [Boletus edulis BED1]